MKNKHTKGPWGLESDFSLVMGRQVVGSAPAPDGATREEQLANAYLIAAAPEMLEALVYAESKQKHTCKIEYGNNTGIESCTLCRIKNAIAKARGGL